MRNKNLFKETAFVSVVLSFFTWVWTSKPSGITGRTKEVGCFWVDITSTQHKHLQKMTLRSPKDCQTFFQKWPYQLCVSSVSICLLPLWSPFLLDRGGTGFVVVYFIRVRLRSHIFQMPNKKRRSCCCGFHMDWSQWWVFCNCKRSWNFNICRSIFFGGWLKGLWSFPIKAHKVPLKKVIFLFLASRLLKWP